MAIAAKVAVPSITRMDPQEGRPSVSAILPEKRWYETDRRSAVIASRVDRFVGEFLTLRGLRSFHQW